MCSKLIILVLLVLIIYTLYLISNKSNIKEEFQDFNENIAENLQNDPNCRSDLSQSFDAGFGNCDTYNINDNINDNTNYPYCNIDFITNQVGNEIYDIYAYQACNQCGVCPAPTTTTTLAAISAALSPDCVRLVAPSCSIFLQTSL